jgi:aryl sulfotransferase
VIRFVYKDGANTFINKGTNGRWREVLSQEEIAKSDAIAARELTPDCAEWLRTGVA